MEILNLRIRHDCTNLKAERETERLIYPIRPFLNHGKLQQLFSRRLTSGGEGLISEYVA